MNREMKPLVLASEVPVPNNRHRDVVGSKSPFLRRNSCLPLGGFTLLEVMIAIFIFSLIIMAIYSTWLLILKGSRLGGDVAASVQRSRIAIRTIEDALVSVQMFNANMKHYLFVADTSGDLAAVSMVSRLPDSFPGARRWGDLGVQRVSFYTQPGKDGGTELAMTLAPVLLETNSSVEAYTISLAKEVSLFRLDFYDMQKREWLDEWKYTNQLPKLVQVTLGLGKARGFGSKPQDVVTRIVAIPSMAVPAELQGGGGGRPGALPPGADPTNPGLTQPPMGPGPGGIGAGGVYPGGVAPGGAGGFYPGGAFPGGRPGQYPQNQSGGFRR
jgi:prepilin-type N-terminal cleavage/methylation domain-containing protein